MHNVELNVFNSWAFDCSYAMNLTTTAEPTFDVRYPCEEKARGPTAVFILPVALESTRRQVQVCAVVHVVA